MRRVNGQGKTFGVKAGNGVQRKVLSKVSTRRKTYESMWKEEQEGMNEMLVAV